ncbi:divalent-cation tolerance protein CutA [Castellaniella sp.]|uniref:divalent-cation tolerance protein CutA n=1 Tax=Castellaniella sp. TaxID=1955812 RepID=UPI002AFF78BD|nr:divalent-cation tolerance protein CutA [Castellaniella sp.]
MSIADRPSAGPDASAASGSIRGLRRQDGAPTDAVVVLSTAPDVLLAKRIAHVLVEESLVACAQVGGAMTSMYLWQGKLEGCEEIPLSFKTTATVLPALYRRLCELHPYEIPEFLVLGVPAGSAAYLDWVIQGAAGPVEPPLS